MPFEWIDYPGRIMWDANYEGYAEVATTIIESSTLFICVDGELLVGKDTEEKIENVINNCSMSINHFFGRYFEAGGKLPPVGIILTKSDLFMNDTNDKEIREILAEAFSPLFANEDTLIGVVSVTLGEHIQDDNYRGKLKPVNTHLPIFMGIWCALNDSLKEYDGKLTANKNSTADLYNRINSANRSIESLRNTISTNTYQKRVLDDKFLSSIRFGGKIDNLQRAINRAEREKQDKQDAISDYNRRIASNNEETVKIQKLRDAMERTRQMFQDYINQIMWFRNGQWTI